MRITHVIDAYLPDLLYQEGYLAREQRRRGHDVLIVCRRMLGHESGERLRIVGGPLPLLLIRLARAFRTERPDVVHAHNVVSQISVAACILKPLFDYRLVVDSHHSPINTRVESPARRVGATLFRMSAGRLIRGAADAIFAIAGPERSFTARLLGCRDAEIAVIPLGVDAERFRPDEEDRKAARARLGLEDDFVIAHAGRLVPEKRIDTLLAAARRTGATVLLAGSLDERLKPLIAEFQADGGKVIMPGVLNKTELASSLRASDVGVWMGFPSLSAVEAMAVGLPLITCATPHFTELLGTDYELFAADTDGLIELLIKLRDQPAFAATAQTRNAARGAALGWERVADRVERIYA